MFKRCSTLDGQPPQTKLKIIAGPIETFEYFYGERFGPVPYWGSSFTNIILTDDEGIVIMFDLTPK